ncbi:hypothetical protein BGZ60DRAFT_374299 [Tricladium varicosporioides]|nr:hypothetical protein BGZ60DRAFT_374299 [Hymenoscyphus varicosporioides]
MSLKFPPLYLLKTRIRHDELQKLEKEMDNRGFLVFDIKEAELVLGNIGTKKRAQHDLRALQIWTEDARVSETPGGDARSKESPKKRQKLSINNSGREVINIDSSTESDEEINTQVGNSNTSPPSQICGSSSKPATSAAPGAFGGPNGGKFGNIIKVLRLSWYFDSITAKILLPTRNYLIYEGRIIPKPKDVDPLGYVKTPFNLSEILSRAKAEAQAPTAVKSSHRNRSRHSQSQGPQSQTRSTYLLHETTSEHDVVEKLPPVPEYMKSQYSCERPTPLQCVNDDFISQLRIIRDAHILAGKESVGHDFSNRAYSAAISTISCYPYKLTSAREVLKLPGCGPKTSALFQQWKDLGYLEEAEELKNDEKNKTLILFTGIFDVAGKTAREFYDRGWRTLEDVVEYGWDSLHRTQQIGVKYYDDFQSRMSRQEVEKVANIILEIANEIRPGYQMVICGGYRKGKPDCGDVDVVLSHPDEEATEGFLRPLLDALEVKEYVTHTLKYSERTSDGGQGSVTWKGGRKSGSGFDSLDHMFVSWQDPEWPTKNKDLEQIPRMENPNVHRRVDIIISPWKTAGCAILGWSGGTTFERDLRQWCRDKKNYKFDSSGVRSVSSGTWIDLEKGDGDMITKEKRVFEGIGLEWRDPTERCTD